MITNNWFDLFMFIFTGLTTSDLRIQHSKYVFRSPQNHIILNHTAMLQDVCFISTISREQHFPGVDTERK